MKKRTVAVLLLIIMILSLCTSCEKKYDVKMGVVLAGDESQSFYNEFVEAAKTVRVGFELDSKLVSVKKNVTVADLSDTVKELADDGCDIILVAADTDRAEYEKKVVAAAKKNKDIDYYMVGGERGKLEDIKNYTTVYPALYDVKYLAGIAAGMKLSEMIENGDISEESAKVGYVATRSGDQVSAYSAFYLGVNAEYPGVPMEVAYGGYDSASQADAAQKLIDSGCNIIAQHTDTSDVAEVCAKNGVFNVGHGFSTLEQYPETSLVTTRFDWSVFFATIYSNKDTGTDMEEEWTGSFKYDTIHCFDINTAVAAKDTDVRLDQIKAELLIGARHVFDTSKFTIDGGKAENKNAKIDKNGYLTSYGADIGYDYLIEVVKNGFFNESTERSYPYFDLSIDGITIIDEKQ